MAIKYGDSLLKIIVILQVILGTWSSSGELAGEGFVSCMLIGFGALSLAMRTSTDLVLMYCGVTGLTVIHDIIILAGSRLDYQTIPVLIHLLLKPIICILLSQIYSTRGGNILGEYYDLIGKSSLMSSSDYESLPGNPETGTGNDEDLEGQSLLPGVHA